MRNRRSPNISILSGQESSASLGKVRRVKNIVVLREVHENGNKPQRFTVPCVFVRNVCEKTLNAQGFPIMDSSEKLEAGLLKSCFLRCGQIYKQT